MLDLAGFLDVSVQSMAGVPAFLAYFGLAVVLLGLFIRIYTGLTPHDEFALIRANNSAAATAYVGALLGFALPLSSAIRHSLSLVDYAIWGLLALVVQVLTFCVVKLLVKGLSQRIEAGEMAAGIFVGGTAVAMGLINAACISY